MKIQTKITMGIVLSVVSLTAIFAVYNTTELRKTLLNEMEEDAVETARFYANSIKNHLYFQDIRELNKIANDIIQVTNVDSVHIILYEGQIITNNIQNKYNNDSIELIKQKLGDLNKESIISDKDGIWITKPIIQDDIIGTLVMHYSIEKIDKYVNDNAWSLGLFGLSATSIMIIIGFLLSKQIVIPLLKLEKAVESTAKGNFCELMQEGPDEIKNIILNFNKMGKAIIRYNKNLENLHTIVDVATEVSITDSNGKILYVNDKFCETSKYARSELIGNDHRILKSGFHPPEFFKNMWDMINKGEIWSGEIKNINKNKEDYWVKTVIMPFKDDSNNITQFMSIRIDITEIHKSREKINEQLLQLKETDRQKDEFISMISHELKSPIFPIIGYCDLLRDPELSKNFNILHFEALDEITSNAERLQRITEDLLDVNRINMKKLPYNIEKFSLAKFVTHIVKEHAPLMKEKQIEFCVLPVEDQIIESDEQRLEQVIGNMIRNAADFVPNKDGKITVSVRSKSEHIIFSVNDNGVGISKENQHNLFTPFYQIDASATRNHEGAGLGLAICKGIVEDLGGKIWVESDAGKGSTFFFSVPLKSIKKKDENSNDTQGQES